MDNIRDRWNEVNGKSLHVDKQTFIEKITPYCMHKWSFKEWMWCWFLKLSNSILAVLGGNIACYCCYIANQTGCMRPDVLNAKYHVKTNATYSCHNRTLYRRSSNMSWILRLVRYYAVIISRCGKLKCKHGGKRCSLALLWQKHQNSSKISMDRFVMVDEKNVSGVVVLVLNGQMSWHVILIYRIILISKRGYRSRQSFTLPI